MLTARPRRLLSGLQARTFSHGVELNCSGLLHAARTGSGSGLTDPPERLCRRATASQRRCEVRRAELASAELIPLSGQHCRFEALAYFLRKREGSHRLARGAQSPSGAAVAYAEQRSTMVQAAVHRLIPR